MSRLYLLWLVLAAGSGAPSVQAGSVCVHVQGEAASDTASGAAYDCLNAELADLSRQAAARTAPFAPFRLTATTDGPTALNLFNQTATRQRLGTNFGVSAQPPAHGRVQVASPLVRTAP